MMENLIENYNIDLDQKLINEINKLFNIEVVEYNIYKIKNMGTFLELIPYNDIMLSFDTESMTYEYGKQKGNTYKMPQLFLLLTKLNSQIIQSRKNNIEKKLLIHETKHLSLIKNNNNLKIKTNIICENYADYDLSELLSPRINIKDDINNYYFDLKDNDKNNNDDNIDDNDNLHDYE